MKESEKIQRVRLKHDLPDLNLRSGDEGVVCSIWFAPWDAYEVEFEPQGLGCKTRALLLECQIDRSFDTELAPTA